MTDYTPGPWRVGKVQGREVTILSPQHGQVADVLNYGGGPYERGIITYAEMMANAHLISKVPDMFHLLVWMRQHVNAKSGMSEQLMRVQIEAFFDRYKEGRP